MMIDVFGETVKNAWQVAAGDSDRNFVNVCLDNDVILYGPGEYGEWPDCRDSMKKDGWSSRKIGNLKRFCEKIEDGDLIVLRVGTSDIYGFGIVTGGYNHNDEFGDVDGWDLQHLRRVRWLWRYDEDKKNKSKPKPKSFDTYAMKFGDTVQLLDSTAILDWINSQNINEEIFNRDLKKLPEEKPGIDDLDHFQLISESLFDQGMSSSSIKKLLDEIGELIRIAKWYRRAQTRSSESETVSYLVVPLLRALGWTPQKMALEWNKVDMALFSKLPRDNPTLNVVVEAKKKDNSCLTAVSQAKDYAEKYGGEDCNRLIVTDGIRYGVYIKHDHEFRDYPPDAYLNLARLRDSYPIYGECAGAKDALFYMSPDWSP